MGHLADLNFNELPALGEFGRIAIELKRDKSKPRTPRAKFSDIRQSAYLFSLLLLQWKLFVWKDLLFSSPMTPYTCSHTSCSHSGNRSGTGSSKQPNIWAVFVVVFFFNYFKLFWLETFHACPFPTSCLSHSFTSDPSLFELITIFFFQFVWFNCGFFNYFIVHSVADRWLSPRPTALRIVKHVTVSCNAQLISIRQFHVHPFHTDFKSAYQESYGIKKGCQKYSVYFLFTGRFALWRHENTPITLTFALSPFCT